MKTRFYSFATQQDFISEYTAKGLTTKNEHNEDVLVTATHDYSIDVVGVIYKPTGEMIEGEDGLFFPEQAPIAGYHVNVVSVEPIFDAQFEVFPTTPARVFGGVE